MGLADEFRSGNFSLYGQWQKRDHFSTKFSARFVLGLIVFGVVSFHVFWSIIAWIMAFLLVFIEIPLCLKCCPTSAKFDNALQQFQNSYFRAVAYVVFAVVMWLAVGLGGRTLQIVSALTLSFGAVSYVIAAARHQTPASSTITGGTGVSTIV
ncbi:Golgi apparatus membrane protein tvp18 [Mortierella hygrophila]|uniref:Golgi apparatus membrane protein tvp18 n=1 Tax=Mortierella hygrophila TaxID=979708 RepID=A0A9P6FDL6_9FUNG|nr:Golgi apparatus membrane protein tvp18 [Mortierella hygrophila]